MPDLPPGFRVVQEPERERASTPPIPQGFRVVPQQQSQQTAPTISAGGRTLSIDEYRALPDAERADIREQVDAPNWRRGVLAPIEKNVQTGDFRPAVPQMALDAWGAVTLPGDVYTGQVDPMSDEGMRRAVDLSTMGATGTLPARAPRAFMQSGERVPQTVMSSLARDQVDPRFVAQRVQAMGPGATVADVGENVMRRAGALASQPGEPSEILTNFMRNRSQQARTRIQSAMDNILGPSISRGQANQMFTDLRKATSPLYEEAFHNAQAVNTAPIAANLDSLAVNRRGDIQSAVNKVRGMLNVTGTDQLDPDPRTLMSVRQEIDDMMYAPGAGNNLKSVLGDIRVQINAELADKVPGIRDADAAFSSIMAQRDAFDYGTSLLRGGESAVDPRDLRMQIAQSDGLPGGAQGPSAIPHWFSQGAREAIDRLIGTRTQDRSGLRQAVQSDGSWNRDKLVELFGEERADEVISIFANEARMAETESAVYGGSKTAANLASREGLEAETTSRRGPVAQAANLQFGDSARSVASALAGPHMQNAIDSRNLAAARALMGRGDWTFRGGRPERPVASPLFTGSQISPYNSAQSRFEEARRQP